MIRKTSFLICLFIALAVLIGCSNSLPSDVPQTSAADTTNSPRPTVSASAEAPDPPPSAAPTQEPIEIIIPDALKFDDSLYYGMSIDEFKAKYGEPFKQFDAGRGDHFNYLTYQGFSLAGYDDLEIRFDFYDYEAPRASKPFGLSAFSIAWYGEPCQSFLDDTRQLLVDLYGDPQDDNVQTTWESNIESGTPKVITQIVSHHVNDVDLEYAEIYFEVPGFDAIKEEIMNAAENADDDAYFSEITPGVTLENYSLIKEGMTVNEVCKHLGLGEKTGEQKIGNDTYTYYEWYDASVGLISIQFKNDKVSLITKTD